MKTVEVAEPMSLFRIHIVRTPVVEKPVLSTSICVYPGVVPNPSVLSSVTAVVPPASPDVPAITTMRSPKTGVAVTVLLPAVVVQAEPADVNAAIHQPAPLPRMPMGGSAAVVAAPEAALYATAATRLSFAVPHDPEIG